MFPKDQQNIKTEKETNEIKTIEKKIERKDLIYEENKKIFHFQ